MTGVDRKKIKITCRPLAQKPIDMIELLAVPTSAVVLICLSVREFSFVIRIHKYSSRKLVFYNNNKAVMKK